MAPTENHTIEKSNTTITTNTTTPTTTTTNNTSSGNRACAACRYQRRKCGPDCPLAPYFPPNQHKQFLNTHKLFGVVNIIKVLNSVQPSDRKIAVTSMKVHAAVRANDPVGGCHRIIRGLERQIEYFEAELEKVLQQLIMWRVEDLDTSQYDMQNPSDGATIGDVKISSHDLLELWMDNNIFHSSPKN